MTIVMPSPRTISKSRFKAHALEYFRTVEKSGQPIVITDRGKPVLKVVRFADDPSELARELRHSVLKYDRPTEPVGASDWETLR